MPSPAFTCSSTDSAPSLESLFASAPPASAGESVARHLVCVTGRTFSLSRCAVLWNDLSTATLRAVVWSQDDGGVESLGTPCSDGDVESSFAVWTRDCPEISDLDWKSLPVRPQVAWLGSPSQQGLPSAWESAIAWMLDSALHFQRDLEQQKLESLAEYAAGAGHEINNPLGSIIGRTSQLLKTEGEPSRRKLLENIGAQAYRIRDMIGDTMLFGRPPAPKAERVLVRSLVEQACTAFREPGNPQQIPLVLHIPDDAQTWADPVQLAVVVSELVSNAQRASRPDGTIQLEWISGREADCLKIVDQGTGFTPEERLHCFDPFYSGRQAGRGLGFGLSKCWRIIQCHGGRLELETAPGETIFRIWLPVPGEDC